MIAVIVTLQYEDELDRALVEKIAVEAAPQFEGLPGMRSKVFTADPKNRRAINFYVWDSEEAARLFFNDHLVERVTGLYGVAPKVDFVEVAALVDNGA
jgi:hypothetical protein